MIGGEILGGFALLLRGALAGEPQIKVEIGLGEASLILILLKIGVQFGK